MTAVVLGPAWSARGLVQHDSRYPLKVEGAVQRAVELLLPGISTASTLVRYYALYAAVAAHAEDRGLDGEACRELIRRSEVILGAVSMLDEEPTGAFGSAHGVDGIRQWFSDVLDVRGAVNMGAEAQSYSPRKSGFWASYGGPSQMLGTVALDGRALRPGRHACPVSVREFFERLLAATGNDVLTRQRLEELRSVGLYSEEEPEAPWLRDLFCAVHNGRHVPREWEPDDHRRRATMRMLGRATVLNGAERESSWTDMVESAIVFSDALRTDPVLADLEQAQAWRGLLLRNYSVSAWRRLWAALVREVGPADEFGDRSAAELQDWLAGQMPPMTTRAFIDELPTTMNGQHPAPAERLVLRESANPRDPLVNVTLLLLGARRAGELEGLAHAVFLGRQNEILNPLWMAFCTREFLDRPLSDLAVRLVDDMLEQARRVALAKMEPDASGRLQMYSRIYERNERYYKTRDEGDSTIGTRLEVAAGIAVQLGLINVAEDYMATVTELGAAVLRVSV